MKKRKKKSNRKDAIFAVNIILVIVIAALLIIKIDASITANNIFEEKQPSAFNCMLVNKETSDHILLNHDNCCSSIIKKDCKFTYSGAEYHCENDFYLYALDEKSYEMCMAN